MSVKVENFGCRLNALEGDVAQAAAKTAGLEKTIIINGCAVTGEALRQARQQRGELSAQTPTTRLS